MKLIRPTLTLLAAVALFAIPSRSEAALTFDLAENMPAFYGYSTRQIGSDRDGGWDSLQANPANTGSANLIQAVDGTLTFTANLAAGQNAEWYADLYLYNDTAANPYGIDAINELRYFANISRTISGTSAFASVIFEFAYSSNPSVFYEVYDSTSASGGTVDSSWSFQGEDLVGGPLILNSGNTDPGILRVRFAAANISSGARDVTITLSGNSITAVVPEPSSALLLTGALGLFGGFFRRRRSLAPVED